MHKTRPQLNAEYVGRRFLNNVIQSCARRYRSLVRSAVEHQWAAVEPELREGVEGEAR